MKLKDYVVEYRKKEYDYSCSEALLMASNKYYKFNLEEKYLKIVSGFSGGMMQGDSCGAMICGISILSILFTNKVAHQTESLKKIIMEFTKEFKEKFKTEKCNVLKPLLKKDFGSCNSLIIETSTILENIIEKYKYEIKFKF